MPQKVVEGAILKCDKGSAPSQLKVSSQDFTFFEDKLVATEDDKAANENILPFGACTVTRSACSPKPIKWDKAASKDEINGCKALLENSQCKCSVGGIIKIQKVGHEGQSEIEG
ncbi:DUF4280 domain-containing protein [Sinomicrobium kalidii]|uniref:DUF4280 domain-containing protein n=1 Tax=Sinomicrobium kalidii TaxID=2900738 RepID=UPI001E3FC1F7|nr:DUF4280 domain-containing protein [Sinomicrobium kalidii]UGU15197.1 DUF4280 domain-containing protein [Sinomicrobium kalidii]